MLIISGIVLPIRLYPILSTMLLYIMGIYKGRIYGLKNYKRFKQSQRPGVIIFNHPAFYDHMVLMAGINDTLGFVYKASYFNKIPICNYLAQKLGCIPILPTGNTASQLKSAVHKRPRKLIAIAPGGGNTAANIYDLPDFRTGAFVAADRVLPVIILYRPYNFSEFTGTVSDWIRARFNGADLHYDMYILKPIEQRNNESASAFATRTHRRMKKWLLTHSTQLRALHATSGPNYINLITSVGLFSIAAIRLFLIGFPAYKLEIAGILMVITTSAFYHGIGGEIFKRIDTYSNFILGSLFCVRAIWTHNIYFPVISAFFAVCGFIYNEVRLREKAKTIREWMHSLYIHIPVFAGFMSYGVPR